MSYQHTIRRLHSTGASLREIADALGLSYQRVHQIVDVATGKGARQGVPNQGRVLVLRGRQEHRKAADRRPGVLVCEQCVAMAHDLLDVGGERMSDRTRPVALDPADRKARCSFCGKKRQRVAGMAEAPDQPPAGKFARPSDAPRICNHCLTLCDEILFEALGV